MRSGGIQQPDVNCEYLTTALQVVCGTERKLAVRKEILQTVAEEHHTTVAAVDCGMRRLIDGVEKIQHRSLAEIQAGLRPDGA